MSILPRDLASIEICAQTNLLGARDSGVISFDTSVASPWQCVAKVEDNWEERRVTMRLGQKLRGRNAYSIRCGSQGNLRGFDASY
jgi:hypothetical protein